MPEKPTALHQHQINTLLGELNLLEQSSLRTSISTYPVPGHAASGGRRTHASRDATAGTAQPPAAATLRDGTAAEPLVCGGVPVQVGLNTL